jgi:hypothetical protein
MICFVLFEQALCLEILTHGALGALLHNWGTRNPGADVVGIGTSLMNVSLTIARAQLS